VNDGTPERPTKPGFVLGLVAGATAPTCVIFGFILSILLSLSNFRDPVLIAMAGAYAAVMIGSIGWVLVRGTRSWRTNQLAGSGRGLGVGVLLGVGLSVLVVGICSAFTR